MKRILIIDSLGNDIGAYCNRRIETILGSGYEYVVLDATRDELPDQPVEWTRKQSIAAAIAPGSLSSPLDDDEWIRDFEQFLRAWPEAGLPVLAICFAHEALASALGGKLEHTGRYVVEMQDVEIRVGGDPLFDVFAPTVRMPLAHSVQVAEAPPGFVVAGSTPDCPIQAMKHRQLPIYGVQFHPEVDAGIKKVDPDWNVIADSELDNFAGADFIRRFIDIFVSG